MLLAPLACGPAGDLGATGQPATIDTIATGGVEACGDGMDNNNNGQVDEGCLCELGQTQACYAGPPGTRGNGYCTDGVQTCIKNGEFARWGECAGSVVPQRAGECGWNGSKYCQQGEVCNTATDGTGVENCADGVDNDGNGLVDCKDPACSNTETCRGVTDGHPTDGSGTGGGAGNGSGGGGGHGTGGDCVPTGPEVCDGKDNDCDGLADEEGVCSGTGDSCLPGSCLSCDQYCGEFRVCRSDGTWSDCRFTGPVHGTQCYPRCYNDADCQKGFMCAGGLCEPGF